MNMYLATPLFMKAYIQYADITVMPAAHSFLLPISAPALLTRGFMCIPA
jgi:hypothetical protein